MEESGAKEDSVAIMFLLRKSHCKIKLVAFNDS